MTRVGSQTHSKKEKKDFVFKLV